MLKLIANCCKPLVFVMLIKIEMTCVTLEIIRFRIKIINFCHKENHIFMIQYEMKFVPRYTNIIIFVHCNF